MDIVVVVNNMNPWTHPSTILLDSVLLHNYWGVLVLRDATKFLYVGGWKTCVSVSLRFNANAEFAFDRLLSLVFFSFIIIFISDLLLAEGNADPNRSISDNEALHSFSSEKRKHRLKKKALTTNQKVFYLSFHLGQRGQNSSLASKPPKLLDFFFLPSTESEHR